MENFKMVSGTHAMVKATEEFLRGEGPPVLTLIGITGCGKSHVLEGIGRTTLHQGKSLRYERAGDFVDYLRHTFQEDQTRDIYEVMKWYDSFHMLLIDDIGMESSTNWAVGKLTSLVDKRISDGSRLAVATNLIDEPEMAKSWGPRLASRLYGTNTGEVRVIRCEAGDYRKAGE
jgi:DNA replication protein DnaC